MITEAAILMNTPSLGPFADALCGVGKAQSAVYLIIAPCLRLSRAARGLDAFAEKQFKRNY